MDRNSLTICTFYASFLTEPNEKRADPKPCPEETNLPMITVYKDWNIIHISIPLTKTRNYSLLTSPMTKKHDSKKQWHKTFFSINVIYSRHFYIIKNIYMFKSKMCVWSCSKRSQCFKETRAGGLYIMCWTAVELSWIIKNDLNIAW